MRNEKTQNIVKAALFMALITAATMVIRIPSPTQGYVNLGDCFVLLAGWIMGPVYGGIAGAVGSALCDILSGCAYYVPGTIVFKGMAAVTASLVFSKMKNKRGALVVSGILGELYVVVGYFLYAWMILGRGLAASAGIPGNLVQATIGIVCGVILFKVFGRTGITKK